ncbi:MAG: competence protein ComEA [Dethiosulfovibrio peptidovorans]|nr:MAG: competence protein ComEA [Dethiosulfovibrio peptidovorans]
MAVSKGKRILLLPLVGLLCFVLAGSLIRHFAGRWESGLPTTVAGPAPSEHLSVSEVSEGDSSSTVPVSTTTPKPPAQWVVYVTGAVRSPGVYHLPPDSRAYHLVESAGGLTPRADPVAVNLAAPLADGIHLHVPAKEALPGVVGVGRSAGERASSKGRAPSEQPITSRPVNLNQADKTDLMALPGVGPVTAGRILDYRRKEGAFRSVDELLKVRGIGPRKLEVLRPLVTVR